MLSFPSALPSIPARGPRARSSRGRKSRGSFASLFLGRSQGPHPVPLCRSEWLKCEAWGDLAKEAQRRLRKGAKVVVGGRLKVGSFPCGQAQPCPPPPNPRVPPLQVDSFTDKTGQNRTIHKVTASSIQIVRPMERLGVSGRQVSRPAPLAAAPLQATVGERELPRACRMGASRSPITRGWPSSSSRGAAWDIRPRQPDPGSRDRRRVARLGLASRLLTSRGRRRHHTWRLGGLAAGASRAGP